MKFIAIKKYVPDYHEGWPAFVISMSDGKDYLSLEKYWSEDTDENAFILTQRFMLKDCLRGLYSSEPILISDLVDGSGMFRGCDALTSFDSDLSSMSFGHGMFQGCAKLTSFDSALSKLFDGRDMFYGCSALVDFNSDLSSLVLHEGMFDGCDALNPRHKVKSRRSVDIKPKNVKPPKPLPFIHFDDLNIDDKAKASMLMSVEKGITIVSSGLGDGKTTTALSLAVKHHEEHGGKLVYIGDFFQEFDPQLMSDSIEVYITGSHLTGEFIEGVFDKGDFPPGTVFFVSEIRHYSVLKAVIDLALSGYAVVTTTHGLCLDSTILKISSYLNEDVDGELTFTFVSQKGFFPSKPIFNGIKSESFHNLWIKGLSFRQARKDLFVKVSKFRSLK